MSHKRSSAGRRTAWFFCRLCSVHCSHRSGPTETPEAPSCLNSVECSRYQTHPSAQTYPYPSAGVEAAELHHTLGLGYNDLARENKKPWHVIKDIHDPKPTISHILTEIEPH